MNHSNIELCTCGYYTYSKKWMRKHLLKEHNDNVLFRYATFEHEIKVYDFNVIKKNSLILTTILTISILI